MTTSPLAAAALVLAACGDPTEPQTHARVDDTAAGCPAVGRTIRTGPEAAPAVQEVCERPRTGCPGVEGDVHAGTVVVREPADWEQLRGVACVDGDVIITEGDLGGLSDVVAITGNLAIAGDPWPASLDGLGGLRAIGGTLLVQGDDGLAGLGGATAHVAQIRIVSNAHLPDLDGIATLTGDRPAIVIAGNPELACLNGLDPRADLGAMTIRDNPALDSLAPLDRASSLGALEISDNPRLQAIDLRSLSIVSGELRIADEPVHMLALPALTAAGAIRLDHDAALVVVDLPELHEAGALHVDAAPQLETIRAPRLARLTGELTISGADKLATLALAHVESITGKLELAHTGLAALGGLASLAQVGSLAITGNAKLDALDGLAALAKIEHDVEVTANPGLPESRARAWLAHVDVGGEVHVDEAP